MKTLITIIFFVLVSLNNSFSQNWQWGIGFGGYDFDNLRAIAIDSRENVYACGEFRGDLTINQTTYIAESVDMFLTKFDSSGTSKWTKHIIQSNLLNGVVGFVTALVVDNEDNVILCGTYTDSIRIDSFLLQNPNSANPHYSSYIAKFDSLGQCLWMKNLSEGGYGSIGGIDIDASNDIYIATTFFSFFQFDSLMLTDPSTLSNGLLLRIDKDGILKSHKKIQNNNSHCEMNTVSISKENEVYLSGTFVDSVYIDNYGWLYSNHSSIYIVKLDSNNNVLWANYLSNSGTNAVFSEFSKIRATVSDNGSFALSATCFKHIYINSDTIYQSGNYFNFVKCLNEIKQHITRLNPHLKSSLKN